MKTIKYLISIFIGIIILMGGVTLFTSQNLEANPEDSYCTWSDIDSDCHPLVRYKTCICFDVEG